MSKIVASTSAQPNGVRLLILDDDPDIGQTILNMADVIGLGTRFTTDPTEFFSTIDGWDPTHIALDLVMPLMDGVEVLEQLALRKCRARIIITSGVGHRVLDAASRSAVEHGLDIAGVLSKPFALAALRELLAQSFKSADFDGRIAAGYKAQVSTSTQFQITTAELERAFARRELTVFYQPKVKCESGALAGFEALVRWLHPEWGLIPPDRFVPFAETHELIDVLTDQVLEQSLQWFAAGFPAGDTTLSVNLSARTLKDRQFVERLVVRCVERNVAPRRLIFELTETSAMEDPVASLDLLTRMRMKEFQLSIDDFGTGYSSMLQLVRLPFSEIKVDKSFVMSARRSQESRTLIKSIVDLGHNLGLHVTAEGVEDQLAMDYLKSVGCDLAQGYLIARPMLGNEALAWANHYQASYAVNR